MVDPQKVARQDLDPQIVTSGGTSQEPQSSGATSRVAPCILIWGWVKTLVPSEPQNSWDLRMFIPLNMVSIGIDPYPYETR